MGNPSSYGISANRCYVGDQVAVWGIECMLATTGSHVGLYDGISTYYAPMTGPVNARFPSKDQSVWMCDTRTPGTFEYALGGRSIGSLTILPRPLGVKLTAATVTSLATKIANASPGDTIWIAAGTYVFTKMIYVNKQLNFRAAGPVMFLRSPTMRVEDPAFLFAQDVYMDGITFADNLIATEIGPAAPDKRVRVVLTNCTIRTQLQNYNCGWHGWGPLPDLTMIRSRIERGGGVHIGGRGCFLDCDIQRAGNEHHPFHVVGGSQMAFLGNRFDVAYRGIVVNDASHLMVSGNVFRNMGGLTNSGENFLVERRASNVAVVGNEFDNSAAPAVQWYCTENFNLESRDSIIGRNLFRGMSDAIVLWKSSSNRLENFAVFENYAAGCRQFIDGIDNIRGVRGARNRIDFPAATPTHVWDIHRGLPTQQIKLPANANNDVRVY